MDEEQSPRVAILPCPGMGHLIPLTELARRLVLYHNFSVTFIIPCMDSTPQPAQHEILNALPKSINSIFLPPPPLHDVPNTTRVETQLCIAMNRSMPSFRDALKALASTTQLVSLLVDLFGTDALDVAQELRITPYIICPISSMALSFCLYLPTLDTTFSGDYEYMPEPLKLPGCVPIQGSDLPDGISQRSDEAYLWILRHTKRYKEAKGILVNSFTGLEPEAIHALKEGRLGGPSVYPVGPVVRTDSVREGDTHECLRWLAQQPRGSVLFVCFGSGGTLSSDQMNELALGLELSGQRFLWVVRCPHGKDSSTAMFSSDPSDYLPKGFVARTKAVGLVVPSWAPQIQVLSHMSTGGFLSHCGWNSSLESIVHGVRMIAWPLYAEQKMNAVLLVDGLKVALRPTAGENGLVGREEIARIVKDLMEGEEGERMKKRMQELKDASARALAEDGSSFMALSEVAREWKNL
ncbi:hydroquinone glucosyltransferase-like [Magnolia sinica]|uniref:hydroquinone glucosyltransferase-like n=1 Tax=Magnolia sinica TaxID=86752 RepID=UPI00265A8262|nr:hydroquinone glucosyltransferase-like [Magnolia sinica]